MVQGDRKRRKRRHFGAFQNAPGALRIVIAGGGTGGHLFPGIAIAQEFLARNPENRVLFVGTKRPFEISILSETGFEHKTITAEGFKGRGVWNQMVSISKIPMGVIESILILKRFKADLVVGVGGYSAGPLVVGAWLLGINTVLHEQNILPGITNRILSRFADRIYVSFKETKAGLDPKKIRVTGNPVRKEIRQSARVGKDIHTADLRERRPFTILILGGSQGAHSINMAVLEAIESMMEDKGAYFFVHQTGADDEIRVKRVYQEQGVPCEVRAFFKDMGRQYEKTDLIICRAGATTVAEVKTIGKAVIFIPFPFAADDHQVLNARSLVDEGAAEMILEKDLTGNALAERIKFYAANPDDLYKMAARAGELGRVDAAAAIVDDCYALIS
jgi:UDP-N-acetylglucosamine--N-acetylmuramyl-(pentapeptide) pyrophosphoryl-undecaprenol N-acetylglucosamine transferase